MKILDNILNLIKSENIILEEYKNLKINKGVYLNIPTLFNNHNNWSFSKSNKLS